MKIRRLEGKDRERLHSILVENRIFNPEEVKVAMELIDIVLKDPDQKDYEIYCAVNIEDQPVGYVCYGPAPMTQGTFDLYWIAVAPRYQGEGIGSALLYFVERVAREKKGRMILIDTSSTPEYERTQRFYKRHGFGEIARVPDYYHPGNDRITYCKKLQG